MPAIPNSSNQAGQLGRTLTAQIAREMKNTMSCVVQDEIRKQTRACGLFYRKDRGYIRKPRPGPERCWQWKRQHRSATISSLLKSLTFFFLTFF